MRAKIFLVSGVVLFFAAVTIFAQGRFRSGGRFAGEVPFTSAPQPKDDTEKHILEVLEEMDRRGGQYQSVPINDGRLLRVLAESLGARHVVELGTSQGYSAIWFCLALRKTGGKLTTYEIDPQRIAEARKNFQRAGVSDLVTLVEGDAHERVKEQKGPIDLVFLDADKEGYLDYFQKLLPLVRPGGLIVAHNINPQQADPRYVQAITSDPNLETLFVQGMSLTLKKR